MQLAASLARISLATSPFVLSPPAAADRKFGDAFSSEMAKDPEVLTPIYLDMSTHILCSVKWLSDTDAMQNHLAID